MTATVSANQTQLTRSQTWVIALVVVPLIVHYPVGFAIYYQFWAEEPYWLAPALAGGVSALIGLPLGWISPGWLVRKREISSPVLWRFTIIFLLVSAGMVALLVPTISRLISLLDHRPSGSTAYAGYMGDLLLHGYLACYPLAFATRGLLLLRKDADDHEAF